VEILSKHGIGSVENIKKNFKRICEETENYEALYLLWKNLFERYGMRIYVHTYKLDIYPLDFFLLLHFVNVKCCMEIYFFFSFNENKI